MLWKLLLLVYLTHSALSFVLIFGLFKLYYNVCICKVLASKDVQLIVISRGDRKKYLAFPCWFSTKVGTGAALVGSRGCCYGNGSRCRIKGSREKAGLGAWLLPGHVLSESNNTPRKLGSEGGVLRVYFL